MKIKNYMGTDYQKYYDTQQKPHILHDDDDTM